MQDPLFATKCENPLSHFCEILSPKRRENNFKNRRDIFYVFG